MRAAVVASQGRHAHRVASATQSCRLQRGVTQTGHWYWSSVVGWCMVRLLGGGTRNGGTGARAFDGTDVRNSVEATGLRAGGGQLVAHRFHAASPATAAFSRVGCGSLWLVVWSASRHVHPLRPLLGGPPEEGGTTTRSCSEGTSCP